MSKDFENNDLNKEPNKFGLPEGYFQKSSDSIFNKVEWLEEHKEFKYLSELKKVTGFIVPENYFDKAEADIELIAYTNLFGREKTTGFEVPQQYFETLEIEELSKQLINTENDLANFNTLSSIKKQNAFIVNENYFNVSEQKITSVLTKQAKVINLFIPKVWFSAAAAVFAIVIGLWIYNQYFKPVTYKDCGSLACLDKNDLVKTKNLEGLDNDELYELVNSKKLKEKLEKKSDKKNEGQKNDSSLKTVSTDELLDEI